MSFLKISDPVKKDLIIKEYLELKKNIRDNVLSERTGELELQIDLSKIYRPVTETQKATSREITEGLKPIKEGIENLPQAIKFPPIQPLGEASGQEKLFEKLLEPFEEEASEEEATPENLGEIAKKYLNKLNTDKTFGINKVGDHYFIGHTYVDIYENNILVDDEEFKGTPGLWKLIMLKEPMDSDYNDEDYYNYGRIMVKTNVLQHGNNPNNPYPKSSSSIKWGKILSDIWKNRKLFKGKGIVVIPSDPNALLERLDLLLASQEAGHTGVRNELVSICDELKRQGVLDTKAYKKLNSDIKK